MARSGEDSVLSIISLVVYIYQLWYKDYELSGERKTKTKKGKLGSLWVQLLFV